VLGRNGLGVRSRTFCSQCTDGWMQIAAASCNLGSG
jgi:hypothetical protein